MSSTTKFAQIEAIVDEGITGALDRDDVLALVEIAEAAREVLDYEHTPSRKSLSDLRVTRRSDLTPAVCARGETE
jgi:hypothetical protein